ncbi:MAG: amino acid adenylation domain-containing protein [Variovorax sp.]|nr:MAG: amino acid adenylation domain-containing protein [Variovorax sp.]
MPPALRDRLRLQAERLGVSLSSLLHLGCVQVVARSSGQDNPLMGVVMSSRDGGAEVLPFRLELEGLDIEAAARQCDAQLHASRSGADFPATAQPQFDGVIDYRRAEAECAALPPAGRHCPLLLSVSEDEESLRLAVDAEAPIHAGQVNARLLHTLDRICRLLQEAPRTLLTAIDVLPDAERALLLDTWNRTEAPWPEALCVHELFEEQVRKTPDAVAVIHGDQRLSYAELNARANRVAHHLVSLGIQPDDRIAVCLARSPAMMVGLLAVLKAGAAYVPIDPAYPTTRLAHVLRDAAPGFLLCDAVGRSALGELPAGLGFLELDQPEPCADQPATDLPPATLGLRSTHLAYVLYTSGSTGTPKGVMIEHRSLVNHICWQVGRFEFTAQDVFLQRTSPAFDASGWELWTSLAIGARLVLLPPADQRDVHATFAAVVAHEVTILQVVPSLLAALPAAGLPGVSTLRYLFCGGEPLSAELLARSRYLAREGIVNLYGPTETTIDATAWQAGADAEGAAVVPIGRPIANTRLYLLDSHQRLVPAGATGELYIGGACVGRGYLHRPDLTAERFLADPFSAAPAARMYRSGDLARYLPDGNVEYLGRNDQQIKIRGFRIEPGEIESRLLEHAWVRETIVLGREDAHGEKRLAAYVVTTEPVDAAQLAAVLRAHLGERLPDYMVPGAFVAMQALPLTPNGKIDRRALPDPVMRRPMLPQPFEEGRSEAERRVCKAFASVLGIDEVGRDDNFFELGGDSLSVLRVLADLQAGTAQQLSANMFFEEPTARALALKLDGASAEEANPLARAPGRRSTGDQEPVALIAMAGRFPGAADVEQFWDNLCAGRDSISFFDDESLDPSVSASLRADPTYVKARGVIDDVDMFDPAFFGINPKEAQLMDPQQRVFLEICWECIERAGYAPDQCPGTVGIYAGMNNATYFLQHVQRHPELVDAVGAFQVMLGNEKDYIATRVAHRLNLTGPAISIHTACSTSLVAVAQAFHALRTGQCDMALAGGVAVTCPPRSGYLYQEGAMLSPDGHTRSFDADAKGTVFSDGAGVVLMKRLSDAVADGDTIYAVLRGVAVNNDGGVKASFTAPSVQGQAAVIAAALDCAGVEGRSISYVETHGTATPMGDPVEIAALSRSYGANTEDTDFCGIGSVKSNVGHLVTAAGVAGLIKTALSLHLERIPATIHYKAPNPAIDFASTPFHVHAALAPWTRQAGAPRRAGVSSFGVGGTNAHVIVEEAPVAVVSDRVLGPQLLQVSARTPTALALAVSRLADHLETHPESHLADVAHTLRTGRKAFSHRACVVAESPAAAAVALRSRDARLHATGTLAARAQAVVFLLPGQGAQYAGMGRGLHAHDPVFRGAFDEAVSAFDGLLESSLRERMFSDDPAALSPTSMTQPATFVLEYALARRMIALGIEPAAFIGHSVGEFAAAVLAGVMSLQDAAMLVAQRGALMQALPAGSMLSVRLSAAQLAPWLSNDLSLAAENAPGACVAAGPTEQIEQLRATLEAQGIAAKLLQTSHAFHSSMMEPAVAPFAASVRTVRLQPPLLPIYSTLTGRLLSAAEATDPDHWARHLRDPVRFSPALLEAVSSVPEPLFLELGPRSTLTTLVRQHAGKAAPAATAIAVLGDDPRSEPATFALAAGRLWTLGMTPDLGSFDARERKQRLRLPTYPFERKRYWVESSQSADVGAPAPVAPLPATPPSVAPSPVSIPESTMSSPTATPHSQSARRSRLSGRVLELFEDVSGTDMSQTQGSASFIDIGLDSLTLTQVALQLKREFKIGITFRQLMESYCSVDALVDYLDSALPLEAAAAPVPVPVPAPVAVAAPVAQVASPLPVAPLQQAPMVVGSGQGSLVQQVIAQQMQLMQQQLAMLAGSPMAAAPVVAEQAAPAPVPVQAAPALQPPASEPSAAALEDAEKVKATYDVKKAFGAIARIHTQSREISDRQRARLDTFMRRYMERTAASKAFTARNRPHMADPRVVNGFRPVTKEITYQIVVDRSKGSHVWDIDGHDYVDVLGGFGMNLFGWQPDFVQEAVRKQLDMGYEIGPQHPLAAEVTQLVCELTGFDRAGLCNTGSEAVMAAIRIARTATGRNTVVVFTGSYHGTFDEVLVRAGRTAKGIPAAPGIMSGMFGDIRVLDYGTPEALEFIRQNADDLAAVLVEPVQSRRPEFQPREFLQEVRAITERSSTCLIFDEVITGFRSNLGGAQAIFGVRADLASYGKVIGGGFPVGVVAGKREFMDALDGGGWNYGDDSIPSVGVTYFAGTFVRHPLALAAAKASLEHLKQVGPALQTQLNLHTAAMADELTAFCREVGAPLEVRYFSSLWRVAWLEDHPLQDLLFAMMRSRGVHILDNFPCFMTTAHTQQDIATIKSAFKESVAEMQEAEFLPRRAAPVHRFDAAHPPVPNARLGRDKDGQPAWFVPDPVAKGKFIKIQS